jgi:regulator of protease activity HflC (stomatin/prohibitin superfamily)
VLVKDEALRDELSVTDLADDERAFVWKDGRLDSILGPGRHAFWRRPSTIDVEVRSVSERRFEHDKLDAILAHADAPEFLVAVHGEARERILFFQEGRLIGSVDEGLNVFWKQVAAVDWKSVDLREQVADVSGQEIMTSDKVTLRVNLVVSYRVDDAERAITVVEDYKQALYREAQLALRAAIGGRELDALLADKASVGAEVREAIAPRAEEFGLVVKSVGLRDVILPGDMKTILNQVIEAQKEAEANLIRRREETAAARSQANTAKLLAQNPALARMKDLEALQEIL